MYTPTPLTIAQQIEKSARTVKHAEELASIHQDIRRADHDPVAETTMYHFTDGSKLLIEPHEFEAM